MLPTTMNAADLASALTQNNNVQMEKDTQGVMFLRFSGNDGSFTYGVDHEDADNATLVVQASSFSHGWQMWVSGALSEDSFQVPFTQALPNKPADRELTHKGKTTVLEAKQARGFHAILQAADGDKPLAFETSSFAGRKACDTLLRAVQSQAASGNVTHLNPVVTLDSSSYVNKTWGKTVHEPIFEVIDWSDDAGNLLSGGSVDKLEATVEDEEPPFEDDPAPKRTRRTRRTA